MHQLSPRKTYIGALTILIGGFVATYLATRGVLIETDLAPFDVTEYSPIDSFYYAMMAFDWFEGSTEPAALPSYAPLPSSLFLNAMVFINLELVGNNFAGLRANVVVISLISALIFSCLMYWRFGLPALVLSLCAYLVSMPWFMASLVVEPTIYRLFHFALLLLVWHVVQRKQSLHKPASILIVWALAFSGPTFVYPTNFFALAAVMALYVLETIRLRSWKYLLRVLLWGSVAGISILGMWLISIHLSVGGLGPVTKYFSKFGSRVAMSTPISLFQQLESNFWGIEQFLLFSQVPYSYEAFLVGFGVSVLYILIALTIVIWGKHDTPHAQFDRTMVVFLLLFTAQTTFVNDYPVRKLVFLFPFFLFLLAFLVHRLVPWAHARTALLLFSTAWLTIPGVVQSREHLFLRNGTTMKQAMESLRFLGNMPVGGGFSHGFRLYNDIQPFLGYYTYSYVLDDMATYNAVMANQLDGVEVRYSIQIEVDDSVVADMAQLGFELDRVILDSSQRGVGRVALFRWDERDRRAPQTAPRD